MKELTFLAVALTPLLWFDETVAAGNCDISTQREIAGYEKCIGELTYGQLVMHFKNIPEIRVPTSDNPLGFSTKPVLLDIPDRRLRAPSNQEILAAGSYEAAAEKIKEADAGKTDASNEAKRKFQQSQNTEMMKRWLLRQAKLREERQQRNDRKYRK